MFEWCIIHQTILLFVTISNRSNRPTYYSLCISPFSLESIIFMHEDNEFENLTKICKKIDVHGTYYYIKELGNGIYRVAMDIPAKYWPDSYIFTATINKDEVKIDGESPFAFAAKNRADELKFAIKSATTKSKKYKRDVQIYNLLDNLIDEFETSLLTEDDIKYKTDRHFCLTEAKQHLERALNSLSFITKRK